MRSVSVWRDSDFHVYAEDKETGERFHFHNYAAAMTDVTALQDIASREITESTKDFVRWLDGAIMPIFHNSMHITASHS